MSSSEEEEKNIQDEKVRRRKNVLLAKVKTFFEDPALESIIGEYLLGKLKGTRKFLESIVVKPNLLENAEKIVKSVEDLFKAHKENIRIREAMARVPKNVIFDVSSESSGSEGDGDPIEWRKPRRLRPRIAKVPVLPQFQRERGKEEQPSPSNFSSPGVGISPTFQQSPISPIQFCGTNVLNQQGPRQLPYYRTDFPPPPVGPSMTAAQHRQALLHQPVAELSPNPYLQHQFGYEASNYGPAAQENYGYQQNPYAHVENNWCYQHQAPPTHFSTSVPPPRLPNAVPPSRPPNAVPPSRLPNPASRDPRIRTSRWFKNPEANNNNGHVNGNNTINQRNQALTYREHREMNRNNSLNSQQSFANNHRGSGTSQPPYKRLRTSSSPPKTTTNDRYHGPPNRGRNSLPDERNVPHKPPRDLAETLPTSSETSGPLRQEIPNQQVTSASEVAQSNVPDVVPPSTVSNDTIQNNDASDNVQGAEEVEPSTGKIMKRRVPVETDRPEVAVPPTVVAHEAPESRENQPPAPSDTSTPFDQSSVAEVLPGNIKKEKEPDLNSLQPESELNISIKLEVKEEPYESPVDSDADTFDSKASTVDEVDELLDDFADVAVDPNFLAAIAQSSAPAAEPDLSLVKQEPPTVSKEAEMEQDKIDNQQSLLKLVNIQSLLASSHVTDNAPGNTTIDTWLAQHGPGPMSPQYNMPASPLYDEEDDDDQEVIMPYDPNISSPPPDMTDYEAD